MKWETENNFKKIEICSQIIVFSYKHFCLFFLLYLFLSISTLSNGSGKDLRNYKSIESGLKYVIGGIILVVLFMQLWTDCRMLFNVSELISLVRICQQLWVWEAGLKCSAMVKFCVCKCRHLIACLGACIYLKKNKKNKTSHCVILNTMRTSMKCDKMEYSRFCLTSPDYIYIFNQYRQIIHYYLPLLLHWPHSISNMCAFL